MTPNLAGNFGPPQKTTSLPPPPPHRHPPGPCGPPPPPPSGKPRPLESLSLRLSPGHENSDHLMSFKERVLDTSHFSMPNMTGRPGYRTMEMNGGSSAPYLACAPCVPLFCALFNRGGNRGAFRLPGAGGGSFPLCRGTFARSCSMSNFCDLCRRGAGTEVISESQERKRHININKIFR